MRYQGFRVITTITAAALVGLAASAGDLAPPAGPVAPTFKTLTEVEPRTALTAENTPGDANSIFRITAPGSYYLTENLSAPVGFRGIEIAASDVTIDLNGFTIDQPVSVVNTSTRGIFSEAGLSRVTVRNGTVRGGYVAVSLSTTSLVIVEGVTATGSGGYGITAGESTVIRDCVVSLHAINGMEVGPLSVVENCLAADNANHGFRLESSCVIVRCKASGNGSGIGTFSGIFVPGGRTGGLIRDCYLEGNERGITVSGTGWTVVRNTAKGNTVGNYSIVAGNHPGAIVADPASAGAWDNLSN